MQCTAGGKSGNGLRPRAEARSRASAAIIAGAPAGGQYEYQPLSAVTRLPSAEWLLRYLLELDQNLAARVVATSAVAVRDFSLGSRVLWCVGRTNCRGLSKTPLPVERGQWSADLRSAWPRPEQFFWHRRSWRGPGDISRRLSSLRGWPGFGRLRLCICFRSRINGMAHWNNKRSQRDQSEGCNSGCNGPKHEVPSRRRGG